MKDSKVRKLLHLLSSIFLVVWGRGPGTVCKILDSIFRFLASIENDLANLLPKDAQPLQIEQVAEWMDLHDIHMRAHQEITK